MKTICTIILALLFSYNLAIAQDTLYILYIYKSGLVVSRRAVIDVDSIIFYKSVTGNTITDYDGNVYNTVNIGTQTWMAANLKTTHYANGTAIPLVTGNSNWDTLTATSKAYCWYDDNRAANANTYGALYTWSAAMNGAASSSLSPSGIQGVCPTGWHLPSDDEWTTLADDYLGGTDVAGGKLKETGTTHWQSPNTGATNESGFTALPGGYRGYDGPFSYVGHYGYWWSSTESSTCLAWYRTLFYDYRTVFRNYNLERNGYSVRCLRDSTIAQDTLYIYKSGLVVSKRAVTDVDSIIFFKSVSGNTIIDYDRNVYNTVTIGTQTWMAENLKTTHYSDSTAIPLVTGNSNWDTLDYTDKAYCWYYDDSATNANTYGALYTWSAAMNGAASSSSSPFGIQGVCPTGWHLSSDDEWTTLTDYLGGTSVAGDKLKETGTTHWQGPNTGATNESGFTALPGGYRHLNGTFLTIGLNGYWWGSTEGSTGYAWGRRLSFDGSSVSRVGSYERSGFSVRCLRD